MTIGLKHCLSMSTLQVAQVAAKSTYHALRSKATKPGEFLYRNDNPKYAHLTSMNDIKTMAVECHGFLHGARDANAIVKQALAGGGRLPPGQQMNVDPTQASLLATGPNAGYVLLERTGVATDDIGHTVVPVHAEKEVIAVARKGDVPASVEYASVEAIRTFIKTLFSSSK